MGIGVLTSFLVLAEAMFGDGMGATLDIGKTASSALRLSIYAAPPPDH